MVERTAKLSLKEQLKKIPVTNFASYHGNRYDDDNHYILHVWDDKGNSFDIVARKDGIGAKEKIIELLYTEADIWNETYLQLSDMAGNGVYERGARDAIKQVIEKINF